MVVGLGKWRTVLSQDSLLRLKWRWITLESLKFILFTLLRVLLFLIRLAGCGWVDVASREGIELRSVGHLGSVKHAICVWYIPVVCSAQLLACIARSWELNARDLSLWFSEADFN